MDNVDVGGVTIKGKSSVEELKYVLALINSRLLGWYFPHVSAPFRGQWYSANRQFLSQLPIPSFKATRSHLALVEHVNSILNLRRSEREAAHPHCRERLRREIDATDRQIDRLVYELYGLTEAEIRLVEAATP